MGQMDTQNRIVHGCQLTVLTCMDFRLHGATNLPHYLAQRFGEHATYDLLTPPGACYSLIHDGEVERQRILDHLALSVSPPRSRNHPHHPAHRLRTLPRGAKVLVHGGRDRPIDAGCAHVRQDAAQAVPQGRGSRVHSQGQRSHDDRTGRGALRSDRVPKGDAAIQQRFIVPVPTLWRRPSRRRFSC